LPRARSRASLPIDPRLLAAEIEATVAEFNRLAALAAEHHIAILAVQVVAPL